MADHAVTVYRARWALIGAVALLIAVIWLLDVEMSLVEMLEHARRRPGLLWTAALVYALCLALPYMPGVELGVLLMLVFGRPGILAAYLATLVGLNLSFLIGMWIRRNLLDTPSLKQWRARAGSWDRDGERAVNRWRWSGRVLRAFEGRGQARDYLLVGLLFNIPGNWVLGGGGGIALVSGLSGRLSWPGFATTVALATCAVPLLVAFGVLDLQRWLQFIQ